jgi:crossover junction endodeoxyribonuclease RusA
LIIKLPFPPAELSGHNNGQWWSKSKLIATYKAEAFHLTRKAVRASGYKAPPSGDIALSIAFYPPDRRGDRVNFANRMKPQIDGLAEGLGVNDIRFLPSYSFCPPAKPGYVEVTLADYREVG